MYTNVHAKTHENQCTQILNLSNPVQFVIFKPLSYCFKETIGLDVKALFANCPESRLIRWYNEPGDITKGFW